MHFFSENFFDKNNYIGVFSKKCILFMNHVLAYILMKSFAFMWDEIKIIEPQHEISNNVVCANSKGAD